ncbi:phosphoribosyltransferase [Kitasatospora sp. NBC_01250]|uniref:phosphoribosyltransferase n=1 Tax=unclassified Kitasatospora TaxID=2633591 RepID=UPI002E140834|nr:MULTISPECIES: phosphoribosyltransferase [unclassified Kitasatospora]WSJ69706.1 phosphoribosyltransferase [Kitasatospora sp. NBC_01302]
MGAGVCDGAVWSGDWVTERLGMELVGDPELTELLGLAVRDNPKRAQLLVSQVLGKHVPQRPGLVLGAGRRLGAAVRERLGDGGAGEGLGDGVGPAEPVTVLGFAETATGLGHCVADELDACYLHSTRRPVAWMVPAAGFEEVHSHATSHLLLPDHPELLAGDGPLVLVDDELSTGQTVLNTIEALHRIWPRRRYLLAALVDLRGDTDRARLAAFAAELGASVEVVALAQGRVRLPADANARGRELVAALAADGGSAASGAGHVPGGAGEAGAGRAARGELVRAELPWPAEVPEGGRHGFRPAQRRALEAALPDLGERLAKELRGSERRVLVLGCEELSYAPLRLAHALEAALEGAGASVGCSVRFSTTTRSPVLVVDDPGYAIRSGLAFPAHGAPQEGGGTRFAYNVAPGREAARRFETVVLVVDAVSDTPELRSAGGLLDQLRAVTDRVVLVVLPVWHPGAAAAPPVGALLAPVPAGALSAPVPASAPPAPLPVPLRGPAFSSYAAEEVGWLLTDLSAVALEAPTEEREEAVQSGGAHYAESLPVEYHPGPEYLELFQQALRGSARRIALAVGTVAEMLVRERGRDLVLASLARAGTPVGILIRRWLAAEHRIDAPHYAVSIIRGRGVDPVALRYLAERHDPRQVVFVDGWTGKGAITRELSEALAGTPFDPDLAVLADPGRCVRTFGTREDFLIPSACLNSTVSGLISRTVLRRDLIGPGDFHGAKYYQELAPADVSRAFLDTVTEWFPEVRAEVAAAEPPADADRAPTWTGWAAVERISAEYGIGSLNLVKPGVGETTRVLLRRVPWRILARRGAGADLDHVRLLAAQRGVPVEEVDELPYSCVGLIHPQFSRGATGPTGHAV